MAIGQVKVNGQASPTAVYGYQPLVIKVAKNGMFTATTGGHAGDDTTSALVEGGYDQAVRTVMQYASIEILGAQTANTFVVIVDGATANLTALTAAFVAQGATVTTSTVLNGDGTFTFA